jgi:hypothetical protein
MKITMPPRSSPLRPTSTLLVGRVACALLAVALSGGNLFAQATGAAAPALGATPQTAPAATPPAAPAAGDIARPANADDANSNVPEGMKVRDPGKQPKITGGPALYFSVLDHDFGAMTNAETKNYRFTFVNAGDAPLTIENVVPKCGCTKPTWQRGKTYQPGEMGYIDIDFTPPTGGHQAKAIMVQSNAEWPSKVFNIRVIGNVESVLSFDPKSFDFGEIRRGQPFETEVTVKADAPATVFETITSRAASLAGAFVGTAPHRGEVKVKITVDKSVPWGSYRGAVLMITTSGKKEGGDSITKNLPFRISGVVVDEIRADDYLFRMETVRPGNGFKKTVFLHHEEGKPIEVVDVQLKPMGLESRGIAEVQYDPIVVEQGTKDGKPGYMITVSGKTTTASAGFLGGAVSFKARAQGAGELVARELPISGRVMTAEAEARLPPAARSR